MLAPNNGTSSRNSTKGVWATIEDGHGRSQSMLEGNLVDLAPPPVVNIPTCVQSHKIIIVLW